MADRRVELWMRSSVPIEIRRTQMAVHDRLRRCYSEGSLDEVSVYTWGRAVYVPDDDREATDIWETVNEFRQWADECDCELRPGFARRHCPSMHADELAEVIGLPIMCLAVYDDGSLRIVAPCSDSSRVVTAHDCLDALENESDPLDDTSAGVPAE